MRKRGKTKRKLQKNMPEGSKKGKTNRSWRGRGMTFGERKGHGTTKQVTGRQKKREREGSSVADPYNLYTNPGP